MTKPNRVGNIAVDRLRSVIERIEKLSEERDAIASDIKEVLSEAAGNGFDPKAIRQVLKLRKLDVAERDEQEAILTTYLKALGMAAELNEEDAA